MSMSLDDHIKDHNEALERFNKLTGKEKRKEAEYLRKLQDRMQSEHNVTILKNNTET